MSPTVRRFVPADADAVVALFRANTREQVADPQRDGFVQGDLRAPAVLAMGAQGGVWLVDDGGRIAAFACSGDADLGGPPPAREIRRRAGQLRFGDLPLREQAWIMYGPVVVDPAYRGRGLLRLLFDAIRQAWQGRAVTGVAFVEESNTRSMSAHVAGLGMSVIGRFDLDDRGYAVLAFAIDQ